ncbi:MAG: DUF1289 domain-containing protein [Rhodospirillaceae bacterium]|nr:DUF1289 domain-containing protein [Rhodospirillaceae bacterium]
MSSPTSDPSADPASPVPAADEEYVASPCISVCSVDPVSKMCIGCLRTLKEIGAWRTMTPAEKKAVVLATEERARSIPRRNAQGQAFAPDHPKLKRFRKT